MLKKRVAFIDGSRLLREMLIKIFNKIENLEVVAEIPDENNASKALRGLDVQWIITTLPFGSDLPPWVDHLNESFPEARFLAVSTDGSHLRVKWLGARERTLGELSLEGLIAFLLSEGEMKDTEKNIS